MLRPIEEGTEARRAARRTMGGTGRGSGLSPRALLAAALLSLTLAALLPTAARAAGSAPGVTTERASSVTENTAS